MNKAKNILVYGSKLKKNLIELHISYIDCFNRIKHKLALAPGHWNAHVKAKNSVGWSAYSTDEDIIVKGNL